MRDSMNRGMLPPVCIIVLNYNGRGLLERFMPCIAATEYDSLEIVVVDNASTDDSVSWLRTYWPHVTILEQSCNHFWAGGNNIGIRYASEKGYRYILFANNDVEPHPLWVREAVLFAETHPEYMMVGYRLFDREAERLAFEAARRERPGSEWKEVQFVCGCSLFCNTKIFDSIGLFDERYEFYLEEVDFEHRALRAGLRAAEICVPVWHLNGATASGLGLRRMYLQLRNYVRFRMKLGGYKAGLKSAIVVLKYPSDSWVRANLERDYSIAHYRPAGWILNTGLALSALVWNVMHLRETRRAGRSDFDRIALHAGRRGRGQ